MSTPDSSLQPAPRSLARRLTTNLLAALVVVALLAPPLGLLRTLRVSSINMVPTLALDDHVVVRGYGSNPVRGDVIVYRSPFGDDLLVGRIVAVSGDRVEMTAGGLHLDGHAVADAADAPCPAEPLAGSKAAEHADPASAAACPGEDGLVSAETLGSHRYFTRNAGGLASLLFPQRTVPDDHVFVLNDNRIDERDSRIYGAIPLDAIVGVASFVYYAFDEMGIRWDRMNRRVS